MCISTESSACSSTSASPNLPTSPSSQVATFRKCTLCPRIAYTTNYNLLTCDACKMFFRRIVILNKSYTCKYENRCRASGKSLVIACKACRFRQCTDAGMMFRPNFSEVQTPEPSELEAFVRNVVWLDARRGKNMKFKFTDEDFSLSDVLENRPMKLVTRVCATTGWLLKEGKLL
uniref:Nuclear receptor domain-containing protein n=1 Tax=Caenorhabditis japonica TaxID=281687 RepID=A0A8R1HGB3_CAEJA